MVVGLLANPCVSHSGGTIQASCSHDTALSPLVIFPYFLSSSQSVKLIDFGEAMELPITPKGSRSMPGTLGHMAPELFKYHSKNEQGEAYGAPADVWAIGCVMFEMLTGIKPEDVAMQLERKADDMSLLLFWLAPRLSCLLLLAYNTYHESAAHT
jgi:serine/threonine protein kinase